MRRLISLVVLCSAWVPLGVAGAAETARPARTETIRVADGKLQLGLDAATGTLRELAELPDGVNQLVDRPEPFGLWQITVRSGQKSHELTADRAGVPQVQRLTDGQPGLRLVWEKVGIGEKESLGVEVRVRLGVQNTSLSRWELSVTKPRDVHLSRICFPRLPGLNPRSKEVIAVPDHMGVLMREPRKALRGADGKGRRLAWQYPSTLSLQCVAYYEPNGLGFYAASDDSAAFAKTFVFQGDSRGDIHFEIMHEPEQEALGLGEYRLPFGAVLGTFCGDWSTAAIRYRESSASRVHAARGRLCRGLVPAWVRETGAWVWNRGRSQGVLPPAAMLSEHLHAPVSVFWHWWHDCAYDAGFPDYLPPREGTAPFQAAMETAHRQGLHTVLYMNQRLWGMNTPSWTKEGAETFAVKGPDGKIRAETYNTFMKAPCAAMCLGTDFWRGKYAGLAHEAFDSLKTDGIYMDQACMTATCYDPNHGHLRGPGRYWTDGFALLALDIRDRCSTRPGLALAGEFCGEPWLPYLDLMLNLEVSQERTSGGSAARDPIPFFQAVYHSSAVFYGNYGSLAFPPYDERWPPEKAPPGRLAPMDRKYSQQYYLEQARSFAWGQQPTLPNFLPQQLTGRPDEIDYLTRLVRTRIQALKYLLHGCWLRPPELDVPEREIDVVRIGVYLPLAASKKRVPVALAGAWRAADGDAAIALASIHDEKLGLRLPIDARAYGLGDRSVVYRIDEAGRHRLGRFDSRDPFMPIELPPRGICVLEFCAKEKP